MATNCRHDWTTQEITDLFQLPFSDLLFQAQTIHREQFDPNQVQISTLLSIKTGACPEDCKYCPQSGHYHTDINKEKLMSADKIIAQAQKAKEMGASRFCMGAAWRSLPAKELEVVKQVLSEVKDLGMETCMTLGMLTDHQASELANAGLDYYNHNLDSSPEYYKKIITTRSYEDRLNTLENVRNTGMKVCCGGIIGMGEERLDRIGLLQQLANLPEHPQSVPINMLVPVKGTPLENAPKLDPLEFVRTIAVARLMMPKSFVRLSAGRENMSDEMQALCFSAGANSIFYGEKLLTTENPGPQKDKELFQRLGITPLQIQECATETA